MFAGICSLLLLLQLGVPADGEVSDDPVVHHYFSKTIHEHQIPWGYDGEQGPENWGKLSPKFRVADEGKQQSPIDIRIQHVQRAELPSLRFAYRQEERIEIVNNGHAIQHNDAPGSFLHFGDHVYALEQFHVHVPSEHTIDGRHADMEIHLVHRAASGEVAVVAVLVNRGTETSIRTPLYKELPSTPDEVVEVTNTAASPADLLPTDHSYFTYMGSFTTPPCTEGVRWIVMSSPIRIHPEALAEHRRAIGKNNRPLQPLHKREVQSSQAQNATNRND